MTYELETLVTGLGHPEGPDVLPDGRIVFVNSFAGEVGVWDAQSGKTTYGRTGGGPNACALAADGSVYVTQSPTVGAWAPSDGVPASIQRVLTDGSVEIVCTEVDGLRLNAPNDLCFGVDGRLWFTDPGRWSDAVRDSGRIFAIDAAGRGELMAERGAVYPNGIAAEPDGSIVWGESHTREIWRRRPDGELQLICTLPEGHVPDGLKRDVEGRLWITGVTSGGLDVVEPDGTIVAFVPAGSVPLNCVFAGSTLYVTDNGPIRAELPSWEGCLIRLDAGVEGMPLLRGSAEHGFAPEATDV